MVKVRWTGAAGLEFTYKNNIYLIDPYFTRFGKRYIFFGKVRPDREKVKKSIEPLKNIASVIVSHTHFDHALDIPVIAEYYKGSFIGSKSLETLMNINNMPGRVDVCSGGEEFDLGGNVSLKMIPSDHGLVAFGKVPYPGEIDPSAEIPMKIEGYGVGNVFSSRLKFGEKIFLHMGSANFIEEELSGNKCDVLFLCVPGWKKIDRYAERIISACSPKHIVLFHFDDFTTPLRKDGTAKNLPFQGISRFISEIRSIDEGINIILPEVNQTLEF